MTFPYDRSALLTPKNPDYVADLERFLGGAYDSDTAYGDVTTAALALPKKVAGRVIAKSAGIFCGIFEMEWLLKKVAPTVEWRLSVRDGEAFATGDVLATLEGNPTELLKTERTLLNVLQRLSGIASLTAAFVKTAAPCRVAATRKTLYGRIDKRAVAVGGGLTHRLSLSDAPMFKDTHFDGVNGSWERILDALSRLPRDLPFVTVEVRDLARLPHLLTLLPDDPAWPIFLLFDNFSPSEVEAALASVSKPPRVFFEASGNITLDSVAEYARIGVDVVSVGALTHSTKPCDLSMQWGL